MADLVKKEEVVKPCNGGGPAYLAWPLIPAQECNASIVQCKMLVARCLLQDDACFKKMLVARRYLLLPLIYCMM